MGLFDKLFGKKEASKQTENNPINFDTTQLSKTAEMLEEDLFWSIIDKSLKSTSNQDEQEQFLIKDLYDYIDNENFKTKEGQYPQFEFTWQEENPESMKKICPKLFDKLWNK